MLLGSYTTSFTQGRRAAIPKKFRKKLGGSFIIARWYEGCLVIVSKPAWSEILDRLIGKSNVITKPVRDTDRFILGSAFELVPDKQGRVVVPESLSTYAGFAEEVTFLGLGDRVEVWDKAKWERKEKEITKDASFTLEKVAKQVRGS